MLFFSLTLFWLYIVQSIKELFAFHHFNNTTAFRFRSAPFVVETDCKDMPRFSFYQIFLRKIFKIFFKTVKLCLIQSVKAFVVLTTLGRKAGAKVETFLIPSKYFCNFFTRKMQVFYNCLKIKRGKKSLF